MANGGNTAAASDPPESVTASAKPRDVSKRLATAEVQTVVCTQNEANARTPHSSSQLVIDPVALPRSANAAAMSVTPTRPTRRGPNRSTVSPIGNAATAAAMPTIVSPTEASARLQPNSFCSGSMNTPRQ